MNQRLARLAAEEDVVPEMLEDFRLAADLDRTHAALDQTHVVLLDQSHAATLDRTHLDRARQAGPVAFLRGFRRGDTRSVLVAKQRLHEFLRHTQVPVHRVHRPEAGHLLLVLLLSLREVRPGGGASGGRTIGTPLLSSVTISSSPSAAGSGAACCARNAGPTPPSDATRAPAYRRIA